MLRVASFGLILGVASVGFAQTDDAIAEENAEELQQELDETTAPDATDAEAADAAADDAEAVAEDTADADAEAATEDTVEDDAEEPANSAAPLEATEKEKATTEQTTAAPAVAPAPSTTPAEVSSETVKPADERVAQGGTVVESEGDGEEGSSGLNAALNGVGVAQSDRDWQVIVASSTAASSGMFAKNAFVRNRGTLINTVDARFQYNFEALGQRMRARVRGLADIEMTEPNSNPDRRFNPYDLSVDLTDMSLFNLESLGISGIGVARILLPTSYASRNIQNRYFQGQLGVIGIRSFGPVTVFLGTSIRKNFNGEKINEDPNIIARDSSFATNVALPLVASNGEQGGVYAGAPNPNFEATGSLFAMFNPITNLTLSYSILYWAQFGYTVGEEGDGFTSPNADPGSQVSTDLFWSTIAATYVLNDVVKPIFDLPFSLSGGVSASAIHSARDASNDFFAPIFVNAFANNRAGDNLGLVSLDLIASY